MECPVLVDMATAVPAYEAQGTQQKWDRQKDWTSCKSQRTRKSALILCFLEMTGKLHTCHTTPVRSPEQGRTVDQLTGKIDVDEENLTGPHQRHGATAN